MGDREEGAGAAAEADSTLFDIYDGRALYELAENTEPPKTLYGDLWAEGEMAVLFGDHGTGKSLLAAQCADRVSRGKGDEPFEMTAKARSVLYLDLEQTTKQFAARHSSENKPYKFTQNFTHIAVDPFAEVPENYNNFVEYLSARTEDLIRKRRPKVVIVDSIAHLKRSNDITRDVLPLVRVLSRLKRELGLSVLLVAPSQRRLGATTLEIGDMQAGRGLCAFADAIFAIGASGGDTSRRYIKQIKARNREILHDRTHTIAVQIRREPTGQFHMAFEKFASEADYFRDPGRRPDWSKIDQAKTLYDQHKSYKTVGLLMGISKTTARRLVQMWVPIDPSCPHHPDNQPRPLVEVGLTPPPIDAATTIVQPLEDEEDELELLNEESRILVEMERGEAHD
ncbi:MAG: AAA family ATPase, partial [Pyrinomonadaceae bacterium]